MKTHTQNATHTVLFPFEEESEEPLSAMGTPALAPTNKPQSTALQPLHEMREDQASQEAIHVHVCRVDREGTDENPAPHKALTGN